MGGILITGASGFVGRALVPVLAARYPVIAAERRAAPAAADGIEHRVVGEIGPETDWRAALAGVDAVVHLAAHVHRPGGDPALFDRVNAAGTRRLAEAARTARVARLIYLSSVKVNGEATAGTPFRENDTPHPQDAYARSKWAAEQALAAIAAESGPATTILRPPLVYGAAAKANFAALVRLCRSGLPLPLGAIDNRRSFIYVGNLAAAIDQALAGPIAPGTRTYLVSDGEDLSTATLIRRLRAALGRPARLVPVPPSWLRTALRLAGRPETAMRLLDSLTVDDRRFRAAFAWQPPYSVATALAATAAAYR